MYIQSQESEKKQEDIFPVYFLPSVLFHSKHDAFSLICCLRCVDICKRVLTELQEFWMTVFLLFNFLHKMFAVLITKLGILDILLHVLLKVQSSMGNIPQQCPVGNCNNKQM